MARQQPGLVDCAGFTLESQRRLSPFFYLIANSSWQVTSQLSLDSGKYFIFLPPKRY